MPRRALHLLLAVSLLAVAALFIGSVAGLGSGCLFLAPALLLALPLLAGRYLGAERLSRVALTRTSRRRALPPAPRNPRVWGVVPPRGGMLIAASLAVRPPPLSIDAR